MIAHHALLILTFLLQSSMVVAQSNQCTPTAVDACGNYQCVQTGNLFFCLCPDMTLKPSANECNSITTTTSPSVILPDPCALANCPNGATCIPTNQNPMQFICLCPNNIIANPNCPDNLIPIDPCLWNGPCLNGGTCVVNQMTQQPVCVCPVNSYGPNCAYFCRPQCETNWCYNQGRCVDVYGQSYCFCPQNYRGRRCELRNDRYNYVYLYYNPRPW